jgi:hypothetical protein
MRPRSVPQQGWRVSGTRHKSRRDAEPARGKRTAGKSAEVTHLTPKQVAQRLQWGYPKVLRAIRAGILPALDVTLPGSRRAEYRVPLTALERFERERMVVPREAGQGLAPESLEALRATRARSNAAYHDAA